jgi:hypothetical protein
MCLPRPWWRHRRALLHPATPGPPHHGPAPGRHTGGTGTSRPGRTARRSDRGRNSSRRRHTPGASGRPASYPRVPPPSWLRLPPLVLLNRPHVAVRVVEEAIARARSTFGAQLPHLAMLTPRPASSLRMASRSSTTSWTPLAEPGSPSGRPSPITTEHAEPGGVIWTTRMFSPGLTSWSRLKPACLVSKCFAESTSRTGIGTTSIFISIRCPRLCGVCACLAAPTPVAVARNRPHGCSPWPASGHAILAPPDLGHEAFHQHMR